MMACARPSVMASTATSAAAVAASTGLHSTPGSWSSGSHRSPTARRYASASNSGTDQYLHRALLIRRFSGVAGALGGHHSAASMTCSGLLKSWYGIPTTGEARKTSHLHSRVTIASLCTRPLSSNCSRGLCQWAASDLLTIWRRSAEEFPLSCGEFIIGQLPVRVELRQLLKAGQRRLRWRLLGRELVADDMSSVSSYHA